MGVTWSIFKKEFRGFLMSPGFLLVVGFFVVVMSWIYPNFLVAFQNHSRTAVFGGMSDPRSMNVHYAVFTRFLSFVNLVLLFMVPALTMKLFSEERKLRTFDLLLTSPITSLQIVLGKYFAALSAVTLTLLVAFLYPLLTSFFVEIHWATLILAFLGIFAIAAIYTAMGLFASSLTENGILALFMALIFNLAVWFLGMGAEVVDSQAARSVFEHLSLSTHLSGWMEGVVRTTAIVFFISIVVLFCFLTERVVESFRWR
jgi:ABC-2 type transport system permease protein